MTDLREALHQELVEHFNVDAAVLTDDTELFSGGHIDSLSVADLVTFVERQLGAVVPPMEITLDNFDSVTRIIRFASQLSGRKGAP